jgi:RNA polymerase sigma factor (sigma-70 family)
MVILAISDAQLPPNPPCRRNTKDGPLCHSSGSAPVVGDARRPPEIDAAILGMARAIAKTAVGRAGVLAADVEDLAQELLLKLVESRSKFVESRGTFPAFARRVMKNKLGHLLEARGARKRGVSKEIPLPEDEPVDVDDCGGNAPCHDPAFVRELRSRSARITMLSDLRSDLGLARALLSDELDTWCARLQEMPVSRVAAAEKMSRAAVYDRINKIIDAWERLDIREYRHRIPTLRVPAR